MFDRVIMVFCSNFDNIEIYEQSRSRLTEHNRPTQELSIGRDIVVGLNVLFYQNWNKIP